MGTKVSEGGGARPASASRRRFQACVAGWSTSKTRRPAAAWGLRSPKRLEPGAQHDRLTHPAPHSLGQSLLGEAAARGDEQAQRPQASVPRPLVGLEAALDAQNLAREGIAKDASPSPAADAPRDAPPRRAP